MAENIPKLKRVFQRNNTSCACACIAMVAGVEYGTVMRYAFGKNWAHEYDHSLYSAKIINIIKHFGLGVKRLKNFCFKKRGILVLDLSDYRTDLVPVYHCIVWDPMFGGRVLDPGCYWPEDRKYYISRWKKADRETFVIS